LGYFVSPTKSQLIPTTDMIHLGFGINSVTSSFYLPEKKRAKFRGLRERLLSSGMASLHDIQSFVGKCNSLRLIFPAASLFSRQCSGLIRALPEVGSVPLSTDALQEISFWRFVDAFTRPVSWRKERHVQLCLSSDASPFAWGSTVVSGSTKMVFRDYFTADLCLSRDMCLKESLALYSTLQSVIHLLWDRRVDILMDNRGLVDAWNGLRASSPDLISVLQGVFLLSLEVNASLKLVWVPSKENPADAPSRVLSAMDTSLHVALREKLWVAFGPFSFDLMSLGSNVFSVFAFASLPFFSEYPCLGSSGTNVFSQSPPAGRLYVYPPFTLIPSILRLFLEWGSVEVVIVVPVSRRLPPWWALLQKYSVSSLTLCKAGDVGVVCFPGKRGFSPNTAPLKFGLSAFLCKFPASPLSPSFLPSASVKVIVVSDSMLKCLRGFSWPHPFSVQLLCSGGQLLMDSACRMYDAISGSRPSVCIINSGINDLSSGKGLLSFSSALGMIRSAASKFCGEVKVVFSSMTQTRDAELNVVVAKANAQAKDTCDFLGWHFVNNDYVLQSDLRDNVHLSSSGALKIHRALSHSLQVVSGFERRV
jgi:hypothetical protein